MSDELPAEPSDLADDVAPEALPTHTPLVGRTDFKPWHRTHKQFVRERQWNDAITRLIKELRRKPELPPASWDGPDDADNGTSAEADPPTEGRRIRCFTLPGEDLLDLQSAWYSITAEQFSMQYLGFNSELQRNDSSANSQVREAALNMRDRVIKKSTIKGYRFQDIANQQSKAWSEFKKYGPYDWVNLDLCDTLLPTVNTQLTEQTFSALTQLLKYQVACQTNPWLMFITTQIDLGVADQDGMCKLVSPTIKNMHSSQEFRAAMEARLPSALSFTAPACDMSKFTPDQLVQNFGVLLGKWLCVVLFAGQPRCAVHLLSGYKYSINPAKGVHMLSMAMWLKPLIAPPSDSTGLAKPEVARAPMPSEIDLAMRLLKQTENVLDIDAFLRDHPTLRESLLKSQADLLAGSGYDRETYLKWIAEQETAAR